jgi:hypothetical protein
LVDLEDYFVLPRQGRAKVARKDKQPQTIVEFLHLNTMVISYHMHFVIYLRDKKKITPLIPSLMWKVVMVNTRGLTLIQCSKRTH